MSAQQLINQKFRNRMNAIPARTVLGSYAVSSLHATTTILICRLPYPR